MTKEHGMATQTEAKHTPGPWRWSAIDPAPPRGGCSESLWSDTGPVLLGTCSDSTGTISFTNPADMPLIAVAPDLLAMCRLLRAIIHDDLTHARQRDHADTLAAADAVITKAGVA